MNAVEEGWEQTLCCVLSVKNGAPTNLRSEKSPAEEGVLDEVGR